MQHIVNVSGGKDSAACYLLAIERGRPFRAVTADTGHEAQETYDWIRALPGRTGGPEVEVVRADFSAGMARKRKIIAEKWPQDGVSQDKIDRALNILHPTGNPFLDLCMWKGRFPSTKVRFCTEELKSKPIEQQVLLPALEQGDVIKWQGERRDESPRRAALPMFHKVRTRGRRMVIYRPIIHWSAEDTFALHRRHGLEPNPLYQQGMTRVGCFPCIMARKSEVAQIARRFPSEVERLREWERLVREASKSDFGTLFPGDMTPEGRAATERFNDLKKLHGSIEAWRMCRAEGAIFPGIDTVIEWAKTTRGGTQYDLLGTLDDGVSCSSEYGLCE